MFNRCRFDNSINLKRIRQPENKKYPAPVFRLPLPTQPMIQIHTLANHAPVALHIKRNTQRNIIIRARDASSLNLSIPKWFSPAQLQNWLRDNEATLIRILQQAHAALAGQPETLPPSILFTGAPLRPAPRPRRPNRTLRPSTPFQAAAAIQPRRATRFAAPTPVSGCRCHPAAQVCRPQPTPATHPRRHQPYPRQNLLGCMSRAHRYQAQLAADLRPRKRSRLCVHPRALPPAPSQPQPRLLAAGAPTPPAKPRRPSMAQTTRQNIILTRLILRRVSPYSPNAITPPPLIARPSPSIKYPKAA